MTYACAKQAQRERGFSLIEMLAVVAIIMIMAAVALPNIAGFLRNYKINGALRDLTGEIQAARVKAITQNTNRGVSFLVVDRNTYRWVIEPEPPVPAVFGPLKDLPQGIVFEVGGGANPTNTVRFNRLGNFCNPAAGPPCAVAAAAPWCTGPEVARCGDSAGLDYMEVDPTVNNGVRITLVQTNFATAPLATDLRKRVRIAPGGRVVSHQQ